MTEMQGWYLIGAVFFVVAAVLHASRQTGLAFIFAAVAAINVLLSVAMLLGFTP